MKIEFERDDLSEYALVADRITLFYERFPAGRIVTELHSRVDREITFRALVYRSAEDTLPAATGWASEREGDGEINRVACLENTETSAVGRALANLGFTASSRRPSREEMEKVARHHSATRGKWSVSSSVEEKENASRPGHGSRGSWALSSVMEPTPARLAIDADPLQRRANAVHDLLTLIERAEAIGFSELRGTALRDAVQRRELGAHTLLRLERRLRAWMARHRPH